MKELTQEELDKKIAAHDKYREDLPGGKRLELVDIDLSELTFPKNSLKAAYFDTVILPSGMHGMKFIDCEFSWCTFRCCVSCDFHGAQLFYSDFCTANAEGADFTGAKLDHSHFVHANLRGACFEGADLSKCDFYDADVMHATFRNANLHGANMWFKRAKPEVWRIVQAAMGLHILQTKTACDDE